MSDVRRFLLPDLGEGLTEAEVVAWHVAAGDTVTLNQVLAEVETEKAVVELPSPFAGTVVELLAQPGDTVAVGAPLVAVDTGGDTAEGAEAEPEKVSVLVGYGPSDATPSRRRRRRGGDHRDHGGPPPGAEPNGRPLAPPPVRYAARQAGVDLAEVAGHGPDGIVTREDLAAHLELESLVPAAVGSTGRETRTPVRGVQKHMAEAMVRSVAEAPQACVFLTVDVTPTVELVRRLRANRHFEGLHVTPLALAARAMVLALELHPALNSSWDDAAGVVVTKHYVNLGIAVAGPHGLVVPNVKDAQDLSLRELVRALDELTATARAGALHARRPAGRQRHAHQRRHLRRGRRGAHPQPGRGGDHGHGGHRPATLGVRGGSRLAPSRHPEPVLRPPPGRRAGRLALPQRGGRDAGGSHQPDRPELMARGRRAGAGVADAPIASPRARREGGRGAPSSVGAPGGRP